MTEQIEEAGSGHFRVPERKTDPLDVWISEQYPAEVVDALKALLPGGDQHSGFDAFMGTLKMDLDLFSVVRDETYNHDQLMETRALVKYLTALLSRVERVVAGAKKESEPEADKPKEAGSRVY